MDTPSDQQLLASYTEHRSETAFAELVRRHVDLVYSAVLRMVGDPHAAKDVTQGVFLALAQNAASLVERPVLSSWLHRTARNLAAKSIRTNVRRHHREGEAAAMNELLTADPAESWMSIAPQLDEALGELSNAERDAIMLRYFERKSIREMAPIFGVSDEAAQKRVTRAVDRLREIFARRGVGIGAGGLVALLSANAVQAAPIGVVAAISSVTALTSTAFLPTTKAIAMTTLQKALAAATAVLLAGTGIYEARQISQLGRQNQALQRGQSLMGDQVQQLKRERDDLVRQLAALRKASERLNGEKDELLKLRGDNGVLRKQLEEVGGQLKSLQLLGATSNLPTELPPAELYYERRRVTMEGVRLVAMAAEHYARNNNGRHATNFSQLSQYIQFVSINAPGGDLEVSDFELVSTDSKAETRVLSRERVPRRDIHGRWERFYGMANAQILTATSEDGRFRSWEEMHDILSEAPK